MPATIPCTPCCPTTQSVNIPGVEGIPGADGANGIDAFTTNTLAFVVPTVGSDVVVTVVNSDWMVDGQFVVFEGPATFQVDGPPADSTHVMLKFMGYPSDITVGTVMAIGTKVSPAGELSIIPAPLTVYAAGTVYQLTNAAALLNFGTTTPSLTINAAGTYLLLARARYDYNAATFAGSRTVTSKLRRTNNTAADIADSSTAWKTQIITTLSFTAQIVDLPPVIYTTTNTNDVIELWGGVSIVPSAGSLDAVEASLIAIKLF